MWIILCKLYNYPKNKKRERKYDLKLKEVDFCGKYKNIPKFVR